MPSQIETAIARTRAQVLAGDEAAINALIQAYAPARQRLVARIDDLIEQIITDGVVSPAEALKLDRADRLLRQVDEEIDRLSRGAHALTLIGQDRSLGFAVDHAHVLALVQQPSLATSWVRVPTRAMQELVGRLSDGTALDRYFPKLTAETRAAIEQALVDGLATGVNPRAIADTLAKTLDVSASRLLTATRTEILSSYRGASLQQYQANADILDGWMWLSALVNACAACVSLHGRTFPLSVGFFASHVRCRCVPVPVCKGVDLGIQPGASWFAEQTPAYQDGVLRDGGGQKYRDGDLILEDFLKRNVSKRWGPSYSQANLLQAEKQAAKRIGA